MNPAEGCKPELLLSTDVDVSHTPLSAHYVFVNGSGHCDVTGALCNVRLAASVMLILVYEPFPFLRASMRMN